MPEGDVQRVLLHGMTQYTQHTIISPEVFFDDLHHIRKLEFAISVQEYEDDVNAVAAPIFDLSSHPLASIAVAGPAYRLSRERMIEIGPLVLAAAREIGKEIEMAALPEA